MSLVRAAALNHPAASSGGLKISPAGLVTGAGMDPIVSKSFADAGSVVVDDCFSAEYDNYRIVMEGLTSASGYLRLRFRADGVDNTSAAYASTAVLQRLIGSGGLVGNVGGLVNNGLVGYHGLLKVQASLDVCAPFAPRSTAYNAAGLGLISTGEGYGGVTVGMFNGSASFDGFTLYPESGLITGKLHVYGYRN